MKIGRPVLLSERFHILLLSLGFLLVFIALFSQNGVKYVNDSHRYIEYAESLKSGFYIEAHNIWYFGYVIFIYVINLFTAHTNHLLIVLLQYLLCYFALIALYKAACLLFNNPVAGLFTGVLFLAQIEVVSWSSYLLCESLYVSLTCFSLWAGVIWWRGKRGWKMLVLMSFLFLFTFITKPTGLALFVGISFVLLREILLQLQSRWKRAVLLSVLLVLLLLLVNVMLATFTFTRDYQSGEIIFAVTTVPYQPSFKYLVLDVPEHLNILPEHYPPLVRLTYFIATNFTYWLKISVVKAFYFLFHIRPYWSRWHNLYNLLLLIPIYFLTIKTLINRKWPVELRLFCIVYIATHTTIVSMTTVDWDGRFLMPVLPVIFILASAQIVKYLPVGFKKV
ncbi:hypothetical protein LVD15_24435 [Fulvivirga maritima]|uniref:hypothetical protein n=1 Tax=Fulvivirga maritima TaxID=2904247 RepID=UPI001F2D34F2|nr:hypothetical protein [Fulvivirga maritima]UII26408.1 hypothetical protein LVD15_24435 [Fulvivirga maritima]